MTDTVAAGVPAPLGTNSTCHDAPGAPAVAIIVAGGSGTRFGNPGGKLLIDLAGRPLLAWTLAAFDRAQTIGHIVVVAPKGKEDEMRARAVAPYNFATPVTFTAGGAERQDSTRAGLAAVPAGCALVAVHDGARPLITPVAIDHAIDTLRARRAEDPAVAGVVCGQPAIDTLKLVDGEGAIEATPPRSRYWTVQTPQVFPAEVLRAALDAAVAEGFQGTDDASLVERAGGRVLCIESPRDNMKVTVPEDLVPVTAILEHRLSL